MFKANPLPIHPISPRSVGPFLPLRRSRAAMMHNLLTGGGIGGIGGGSVYEDFTTYTRVEPDAHITVVSPTEITHDAYRNETAYLYSDKGAAHFGDFVHLVDVKVTNIFNEINPRGIVWMLSNNLNDAQGILASGTQSCLNIYPFMANFGLADIWLAIDEVHDGARFWQISAAFAMPLNTTRYFKITKTGTAFSVDVYSDAARTLFLFTLSLVLQHDYTFRYIFGCNTWNTGDNVHQVNDIQNLKLV